mmetsp:Transcript_11216/g.43262  ORF Transcript_11216/g.43262 Transcript_11216/m.43262 type:complete len:580 (+) Transcript_11216:1559-3298(+)
MAAEASSDMPPKTSSPSCCPSGISDGRRNLASVDPSRSGIAPNAALPSACRRLMSEEVSQSRSQRSPGSCSARMVVPVLLHRLSMATIIERPRPIARGLALMATAARTRSDGPTGSWAMGDTAIRTDRGTACTAASAVLSYSAAASPPAASAAAPVPASAMLAIPTAVAAARGRRSGSRTAITASTEPPPPLPLVGREAVSGAVGVAASLSGTVSTPARARSTVMSGAILNSRSPALVRPDAGAVSEARLEARLAMSAVATQSPVTAVPAAPKPPPACPSAAAQMSAAARSSTSPHSSARRWSRDPRSLQGAMPPHRRSVALSAGWPCTAVPPCAAKRKAYRPWDPPVRDAAAAPTRAASRGESPAASEASTASRTKSRAAGCKASASSSTIAAAATAARPRSQNTVVSSWVASTAPWDPWTSARSTTWRQSRAKASADRGSEVISPKRLIISTLDTAATAKRSLCMAWALRASARTILRRRLAASSSPSSGLDTLALRAAVDVEGSAESPSDGSTRLDGIRAPARRTAWATTASGRVTVAMSAGQSAAPVLTAKRASAKALMSTPSAGSGPTATQAEL